ncbi:MAG: F0F1 ATP synthase subunit B [Geminicoccaceae bacterium]
MLELVLLICLILLVALVWKPVKTGLLGTLDGRAEKIRHDLDEAQRLHEEAKALLAKYEGQLHEGERLAGEIATQAETQRERLEAKMRADYETALKRRTELAMERIQQEEARAMQEVRTRAADLAVRTTRRLLTERIGQDEAQSMVKSAIAEVGRKLA